MEKQSISQCITEHLNQYFTELEGSQPDGVYEMVLQQVEKPMLRVVLQHCHYNQSKAAQMLGINRNTLRKKIIQYQINTEQNNRK